MYHPADGLQSLDPRCFVNSIHILKMLKSEHLKDSLNSAADGQNVSISSMRQRLTYMTCEERSNTTPDLSRGIPRSIHRTLLQYAENCAMSASELKQRGHNSNLSYRGGITLI